MQDCSNSSALAMELLQSCTKPSIYNIYIYFNIQYSWVIKSEFELTYFLLNWYIILYQSIIQIKICKEYRDMLPRPRLVCQEPGLRPIGWSPGVPDKSSQNDIFCAQHVVNFSVWFLQLTVFKYLVASHVTEPGSLLTEPGAVIKFSHFCSHPGTCML